MKISCNLRVAERYEIDGLLAWGLFDWPNDKSPTQDFSLITYQRDIGI